MQTGNDEGGAFVHLDRTAGELVQANADLTTADNLHRRMSVEGIAGGGQHAKCEESDATVAKSAAAALSQGGHSGRRAAEYVAKVLNELGDLWCHEVSLREMIFDQGAMAPPWGREDRSAPRFGMGFMVVEVPRRIQRRRGGSSVTRRGLLFPAVLVRSRM